MGNHTLFSSRSLFKTSLVLFCAFAFCLSLLPDAEAQRRGGWGGYRSTPTYRPPVYRPAPTPRPLTPKPVTPRPTTPTRPGSSPTGKPLPTIKPSAPVTGVKGYKGQVTAKGLPVVQYKGKNYQIPQQGVSKSLKSNLLASTSLSTKWNAQKKTAVKKRVGALAAGTTVAAIGASGIEGTDRGKSSVPAVTDKKLQNLVNDLYKGTKTPNPIGSGSTADAIRHELRTGQPVYGTFHSEKGRQYVRALENWKRANPNAPRKDREEAERMLNDLKSALAGQ